MLIGNIGSGMVRCYSCGRYAVQGLREHEHAFHQRSDRECLQVHSDAIVFLALDWTGDREYDISVSH